MSCSVSGTTGQHVPEADACRLSWSVLQHAGPCLQNRIQGFGSSGEGNVAVNGSGSSYSGPSGGFGDSTPAGSSSGASGKAGAFVRGSRSNSWLSRPCTFGPHLLPEGQQ